MKYGRLTVVGIEGKTRDKHECLCDCGKTTMVILSALRSGNTKSCGCYRVDDVKNRFTKHSAKAERKASPEYTSWQLMKDRCLNPNNNTFEYYGGGGVTVCDRWRDSFENFIEDMGEKPTPSHTIDRKNGSKTYSPNTCRWATKREQSRNRKDSIMFTLGDKTKHLADWSEQFGIPYRIVRKRVWRGWSELRALTTLPKPIGA